VSGCIRHVTLFILLVCGLVVCVRSVSAAQHAVTLRVDLDAGAFTALPTYVCVFTRTVGGQDGKARERDSAALLGLLNAPDASRKSASDLRDRIASAYARNTEVPYCQPEAKVDDNKYPKVICAANEKPPAGEPSVAFLTATSGNSLLTSVELAGRSLFLRFESSTPTSSWNLQIVGGHYGESPTRSTGGEPTALPIQARCGKHRVLLPPILKALAKPLLVNDEQQFLQLDGTVVIPYDNKDSRLRLRGWAQAPLPSGEPREFEASFEWHGVPPEVIAPAITKLPFSWKKHCVYALKACPNANLVQPGYECDEPVVHGDYCNYTCSKLSSSAPPLQFPTKVRFQVDSPWEESWEDRITAVNDTLTSYVPPDERHLIVCFDKWFPQAGYPLAKASELMLCSSLQKTHAHDDTLTTALSVYKRESERIDSVEVRAPGGASYRVDIPSTAEAATPWVRVRAPGLGCNDPLSYQVQGERQYERVIQQPKRGTVILDVPHKPLLSSVHFAFAVGTGIQTKPYEAAAVRPYAVLEGILAWHPFIHRPGYVGAPAIEIRAGAIVTQQWARTEFHMESASKSSIANSSWYYRIPLGVDFVWRFEEFMFGLGPGAVVGGPILKNDSERVLRQVSAALNARIGWYLSPHVAIESAYRGIVADSTYRYDVDFRGSPIPNVEDHFLHLVELRLRCE
jgi:hypothetical protein